MAVFFRIDRFPLSWAPMYSVYTPSTASELGFTYRDKAWLAEYGWLATKRDGSTEWVNQKRANLPTRNMWRLYYQRTRGKGPPKYTHMNHDANTIDRWIFGLEPGEKYIDIDWHRRLLVAVNKTFGRHPANADFIVSLEAKAKHYVLDRETLAYKGMKDSDSVATWDEAWAVDF
jgi:hypothetical protein